ncbi:HWE histidine kinase domain-containing protein [Acetobacter malorum]|uniref:HWE histidine kinase domain-containing protein n=1 Tax=Acetobacter malorum TaxID=178901 RepID=UPI0039EABB1E
MVEFGQADLTSCDKEPIHIPGSIQPHGCLLACEGDTFRVRRVSANAATMLGLAGLAPGVLLSDYLSASTLHALRNALAHSLSLGRPAYMFGVHLAGAAAFDLSIHVSGDDIVIECEPEGAPEDNSQSVASLRMMLDRLRNMSDMETLFRAVVRLMRGMLHYDRVMIYRFDPDWSGKIVAEARSSVLESFLGQHFPSADIPAQARDLYQRALIRMIGDVGYTPVPVQELPGLGPLDMSLSQLRSVSPIHCEYLSNMGVGASMSISLMVDGKLWGMIACHNYSPKILTLGERTIVKIFGEFVALRIVVLLRTSRLQVTQQTHILIENFLREAVPMSDMPSYLRQHIADLAPLIPCDGIGLWINGQWTTHGSAPSAPDVVLGLVSIAHERAGHHIWHTDHLTGLTPDAAGLLPDVAGVMIIPISAQPKDYVFLFRREILQTLNWGGDPNKTYTNGPLGPRLTPRTSFAIWKEEVQKKCLPWTDNNLEAAGLVRSGLIEVMGAYHQQQLKERSQADTRQRMLNEELSHRVKNILAVVQSLMARPVPEGRTMQEHFVILQGRVKALATAHDQVVRTDGGGLLYPLLEAELAPYRLLPDTITLSGPQIWLTGRALSVIALIVHELATNAAKYGAFSNREGRLHVSWWQDEATQDWVITWQEAGGPPISKPESKGFGSILLDRAVPHELHGKTIKEFRTEGLFIRFNLPSHHAELITQENSTMQEPLKAEVMQADRVRLQDKSILIVEDQLLIAMDVEQALSDHGLSDVRTVSSVYEALQAIRTHHPDLALLDFNLGDETSTDVARTLRERGIPFLFATGYADRSMIPTEFHDVPVVRKPYAPITLIREMEKLIG